MPPIDLIKDEELEGGKARFALPQPGAYRGRVNAAIPAAGIVLPAARLGPGTEPVTYSVENLPAGLAFAADTRKITGTPTAAHDDREVTITATDSSDTPLTASRTFDFPVVAADAALDENDWDSRGYGLDRKTVDFFALIESEEDVGSTGTDDMWLRPPRGTKGVLLPASPNRLGLRPQNVLLTRLRFTSGAANVTLNHNGTDPDGGEVSGFRFDEWIAGHGADKSLYLQNLTGTVELPFAQFDRGGGGFAGYDGTSAAQRTILRSMDDGTRFIMAMADAT